MRLEFGLVARIEAILTAPVRIASWLIVPIVLLVLVSVVASLMRVSSLMSWEGDVFLLGQGISMNTLLEAQWHLFALLTMVAGSYAFVTDNHIRVDVVSGKLSSRSRSIIDVVGDLFLLIPFCWFMTTSAWPMVKFAIATGERSGEDGLSDRWLVKAVIPLGFALLGVFAVLRISRNLHSLVSHSAPSNSEPVGENNHRK